IAAGRARQLEAVVVTGPAQAGVLIGALRARVAAESAVGLVVDLTGACAVAGVGVVALAARRITAGRTRRLEAVVRARPVAVAFVLVGALGARVAAVRACRDVIGLAGAAAVAGVSQIALARGRAAAGRTRRLEAVVGAG